MNNIFNGKIVENFLSSKENKDILNTILNIDIWNNEAEGSEFYNNTLQLDVIKKHDEDLFLKLIEIKERLKKLIINQYDIKNNIEGSFYIASRKPENLSSPHRDAQPNNIPGTEKLVYSSIIYLNNDFNGGSLYYPEYEIYAYPKPGLLVVHPATYLHAIQPYSGANRYTILSFWVNV